MTTEPTTPFTPDITPIRPAHHVTHEDIQGWHRWACQDCDWATPLTVYTLPWAGPAAARHAAGDREDDP